MPGLTDVQLESPFWAGGDVANLLRNTLPIVRATTIKHKTEKNVDIMAAPLEPLFVSSTITVTVALDSDDYFFAKFHGNGEITELLGFNGGEKLMANQLYTFSFPLVKGQKVDFQTGLNNYLALFTVLETGVMP